MDCMKIAIKEAKKAYLENNVPVGAVIVYRGKVIASSHNTKNSSNIAVNHAEILCIVEACKYLNSWYLNECDIYVTLYPCNMCLYALAEARIRNVYFLLNSNYEMNLETQKNNINFIEVNDIYEYGKTLNNFFRNKRE